VGKVARKSPAALVSGSGLWLIGGALLFAAAVLAWAFQSDAPARPEHKPRLRLAARASRGGTPIGDIASNDEGPRDRGDASGALEGRAAPEGRRRLAGGETPGLGNTPGPGAEPRAPSASDYSLLLEGNAFRPRIVPRRAGSGASAHPGAPRLARRPASDGTPAPGGPDAGGGWHGWKFDGVAQLDEQTYALMDQPNQKQSRFVKEGDRLEDATIAQVSESQVVLREAGGGVVRVPRVDAMAELLRSGRTTPPLPQGAVPALTGPTAGAPIPGQGPIMTFPSGQVIPQGPSAAAAAVEDASAGGRRGRRSRQQNGAGDTGGQ
jgi:hypothetical protein